MNEPLRGQIAAAVTAYDSPRDFFVTRVAEGVATLAAAFAPEPVIVRMSDFKSNEYANLVGGELYEPNEENPMIGFRGAARYLVTRLRRVLRHGVRGLALRPRRDGVDQRQDHDPLRQDDPRGPAA